MLNDLRQALRLFGRAPGFAAAAAVSIGLAIGANAAIFSLADALFLRPLAVPDPSGLVTLGTRPWQDDGRHSLPDYADFRDANRSFASLAALRTVRAGISSEAGTSTDLRIGFAVTSNFLATFGVPPEAGRDFTAAEGQVAGQDAVVLLGHDYWVRELDQDPSIVGRTVRLNGRPFDVIGIVPDGFSPHLRPGASGLLRAGDDGARARRRARRRAAHRSRAATVHGEGAAASPACRSRPRATRPPRSSAGWPRPIPTPIARSTASCSASCRAVSPAIPNSPRLIALLGLLTIVLLVHRLRQRDQPRARPGEHAHA